MSGQFNFTCFQISEENKWRLKEISAKFRMEESVVVNHMIESLHNSVFGPANTEEPKKPTEGEKPEKTEKSEKVRENE